MSGKEIHLGSAEAKKVEQCHLMPCRIEHEKPTARVREYFWPTIRPANGDTEVDCLEGDDDTRVRDSIREAKLLGDVGKEENPLLKASFRGRPLLGRKLELPTGYKVIAQRKGSTNAQDNHHFEHFTYWNWDEIPCKDDAVVKSMQWVDIAKAIHET